MTDRVDANASGQLCRQVDVDFLSCSDLYEMVNDFSLPFKKRGILLTITGDKIRQQTEFTTTSSYRSNGLNALWMALIFLYLLSPASTAAKDLPGLLDDGMTNKTPWSISADTMSYDAEKSLYKGNGNVIIAREKTQLTAEEVMFDPKDMIAKASGNVVLTAGLDRLTCQRIELDLNTETGTLYQSSVFLNDGHFYIRGDKIEKTGADSYFAEKATVTTCDGENPDWKITARKLDVTIEGYGIATHAAVWAGSIPVLYTPFLAFPVKIKRQTGLISPRIGGSNRKGVSYEQPLFWAINDQSDMTFNLNYMEKRGQQYGLEYRYFPSRDAKGMLMLDWLDDLKVDRSNDNSYGYDDDGYLRPDHERYWFRMKHDQSLGAGYNAKLDLDIVSDQDYLPEFKNTLTGLKNSKKAFETFMGRGFEDYTDIRRSNSLNLSKTWTSYNLNAGIFWTDFIAEYNLASEKTEDPSVQYLPAIDFDSSKHRLGQTPFYTSLNTQYTFLYRRDLPLRYASTVTRTHRMDIYPRIFLPFNWNHYLSIEPSIGVRETAWYAAEDKADPKVDNQDGTDILEADLNEYQSRELWDFRLDLSNGFYRIYHTALGDIDRIKHDILPKITYQYLPRVDQDDHPSFDLIDRIPSRNLITYSLTNILTYRRQAPLPPTAAKEDSDKTAPVYRQIARLKLEQSYDLSDGNDPYINYQYGFIEDSEDDGDEIEFYDKDYPYSELYGALEITPVDLLAISADGKWSFYDHRLNTGNLSARLWDQRGDQLKTEYRFNRRISPIVSDDNTQESFFTSVVFKLTHQLSFFGAWERDLYEKTDIEYGGGFLFESQCWALEVSHTVEGSDHSYFFTIDLYGLGKIGT